MPQKPVAEDAHDPWPPGCLEESVHHHQNCHYDHIEEIGDSVDDHPDHKTHTGNRESSNNIGF